VSSKTTGQQLQPDMFISTKQERPWGCYNQCCVGPKNSWAQICSALGQACTAVAALGTLSSVSVSSVGQTELTVTLLGVLSVTTAVQAC